MKQSKPNPFAELSKDLHKKRQKALHAKRYYAKNREKLTARANAWNKAHRERRNLQRRKSKPINP